MKSVLVITPDISKIQSYTGKLGYIIKSLYLSSLNLKLNIIVKLLKSNYQITLLSSDYFKFPSVQQLYYSQFINARSDPQNNQQSWQLIRKINSILQELSPNFISQEGIAITRLHETNLAGVISYEYLSFFNLYQKILKQQDFKKIIILNCHPHSLMAKHIAVKEGLPVINIKLLSLDNIICFLDSFFRKREQTKKLQDFLRLSSQARPNINSGSILLSVDFFRHLKILVPLYKYLAKNNQNPLLVTPLPLIKTNLNNFNLNSVKICFLPSFLPQNYYRQNQKTWQKQMNTLHRQAKIYFLKKNNTTEDFLLKLFFKHLSPIIKYGFIISKLYLKAGNNLFEILKPKAVIVAADVRQTELTLSLLAKKYHIVSILVSPRTIIFNEEPSLFNTTDLISTAGKQAYQKLIKLGVPKTKIIIAGDPSYQYISSKPKNQVYRLLGIKDLSKKIILLISDRTNPLLSKEEKKQTFKIVSQAVKKIKNAVLVIKPHPTEKKHRLVEETKSWQINNAIISDNYQLELFDLLKYCQVVLLAWSMTGLEATMFNRPVIVVNPTDKDYDQLIPYVKNEGAVLAKSTLKLIFWLKILTDHNHPQTKNQLRKAHKFAEYYIKSNDNQATKRITQALLNASL